MEKIRHRRGILTAEQIYSDLKRAKSFIDNAKEPVRNWHLITNNSKGTVGFMSGPMVRILTSNNILKSSVKHGYTWNNKIPVSFVLATKIQKEWEEYRNSMNLPVSPCVAHSKEPEVVKAKRTVIKRKTVSKDGWLKKFFKWIW